MAHRAALDLIQTPAYTARPRLVDRAMYLFTHQLSPLLIAPTHWRMAKLSWTGWLVTKRDCLPVCRPCTRSTAAFSSVTFLCSWELAVISCDIDVCSWDTDVISWFSSWSVRLLLLTSFWRICDTDVISWLRTDRIWSVSVCLQLLTSFSCWMTSYVDCDDVSWITVRTYTLSCSINDISALLTTTISTLKQLAKHFQLITC